MVSAALVEACKPTERIRDTNIHKKHSPRYTSVPVFINRWNEAETEASRASQTEDKDRRKEPGRKTTGRFLAILKLLMQSNNRSERQE